MTVPKLDATQAGHCRTLAEQLPEVIAGRRRAPRGSTAYVMVWNSSPRTVLRCGVPRPQSLNIPANQQSIGPNVNDVQWYMEQDGHGGYRFTTTLRALYVEVSVPAGAFPYLTEPLADISNAVRATIPDLSGRTGAPSSSAQR